MRDRLALSWPVHADVARSNNIRHVGLVTAMEAAHSQMSEERRRLGGSGVEGTLSWGIFAKLRRCRGYDFWEAWGRSGGLWAMPYPGLVVMPRAPAPLLAPLRQFW